MFELSVILPAYQEEKNLIKILPRIQNVLDKLPIEAEIVVVDTMNPMDKTEIVCRDNGARYISRRGGDFYGDAIRTGIAVSQGKYLVIMDADGSHDPKEIVRFLAEIEDCDMVIGSRYCKGGKTNNNFVLKLMSWVLNKTYRFCFGIPVKDISDSFRLYKAEQLKKMKLECQNFDIVEEIIIKLYYTITGFKIKEVPIYFDKRDEGVSKRNLWKFICSYIKTMKHLLRMKKTMNQLQ